MKAALAFLAGITAGALGAVIVLRNTIISVHTEKEPVVGGTAASPKEEGASHLRVYTTEEMDTIVSRIALDAIDKAVDDFLTQYVTVGKSEEFGQILGQCRSECIALLRSLTPASFGRDVVDSHLGMFTEKLYTQTKAADVLTIRLADYETFGNNIRTSADRIFRTFP